MPPHPTGANVNLGARPAYAKPCTLYEKWEKFAIMTSFNMKTVDPVTRFALQVHNYYGACVPTHPPS